MLNTALHSKILDAFRNVLSELSSSAKAELLAQGHKATGRGIASIEPLIQSDDAARLVGVIMANDYLIPVDTGVKADKIPFSGKGKGGTSKYIQGLLNWISVIRPGLTAKESLGFAFAIAHKHKKEGNPTRGSYSFSSNGRRTGWIEYGIQKNVGDIPAQLRLVVILDQSFTTAITAAATA
jgi:hypothetical protein